MGTKINPVRNAPSLLHAVALVGDTERETALNIRRMMAGLPPNLYSLAVQLMRAVLSGQPYEWALKQAAAHPDERQARYAKQLLEICQPFLEATTAAWFRDLDVEWFQAGPDLQIPIRLHGLMRVEDRIIVVVLHLWQKALGTEQKRAAATILKDRLSSRIELRDAELCWIDLSVDGPNTGRSFKMGGWADHPLMSSDELKEFTDRLCAGWEAYQADPLPPRPKRPRKDPRQDDLFGRPDDPTP